MCYKSNIIPTWNLYFSLEVDTVLGGLGEIPFKPRKENKRK